MVITLKKTIALGHVTSKEETISKWWKPEDGHRYQFGNALPVLKNPLHAAFIAAHYVDHRSIRGRRSPAAHPSLPGRVSCLLLLVRLGLECWLVILMLRWTARFGATGMALVPWCH